jgi:uncharacterized protein YdhG (YjbR/CyaY superfamily)
MNSRARTSTRKAAPQGPDRGRKAVMAYLATLPRDSKATLQRLRKDIHAAAPKAEELMAWSMPAFKQSRLLVCYAAFKEHCSLFPMSLKVMRDLAAELRNYDTNKGTIRFPIGKPLPVALVRRIVRARIVEVEAGQPLRRGR